MGAVLFDWRPTNLTNAPQDSEVIRAVIRHLNFKQIGMGCEELVNRRLRALGEEAIIVDYDHSTRC